MHDSNSSPIRQGKLRFARIPLLCVSELAPGLARLHRAGPFRYNARLNEEGR
jgi:hypothetical protein